jgi:hypothetical protein
MHVLKFCTHTVQGFFLASVVPMKKLLNFNGLPQFGLAFDSAVIGFFTYVEATSGYNVYPVKYFSYHIHYCYALKFIIIGSTALRGPWHSSEASAS